MLILDDNLMERVIKLETNYENLKSIVENNHKSIKGNIGMLVISGMIYLCHII